MERGPKRNACSDVEVSVAYWHSISLEGRRSQGCNGGQDSNIKSVSALWDDTMRHSHYLKHPGVCYRVFAKFIIIATRNIHRNYPNAIAGRLTLERLWIYYSVNIFMLKAYFCQGEEALAERLRRVSNSLVCKYRKICTLDTNLGGRIPMYNWIYSTADDCF